MKRYIAIFLALLMLFALLPVSAFAASDMQASTAIKNYIKSKEGLRLTAYIATPGESCYTIGYGHCSADIYYGMTITEAQADAYFDSDIKSFEQAVNKWNAKYNLNLTQNQFDALVSTTYNFGTAWVEYYTGWRLSKYLKNGFKDSAGKPLPDVEIADSFGVLCSAGGTIYSNLINRRLDEARIFLYGDYDGSGSKGFTYVWYDGSSSSYVPSGANKVVIFEKNAPYGSRLLIPSRSGYYFNGWKTSAGDMLYPTSYAKSSARVTSAVWSSTPVNYPTPTGVPYTVTINGGSGSGSYYPGDTVSISADIPDGKVFTGWTATGVSIAKNGDAWSFTMPASNVTVTANFENAKKYSVSVNGGSGSGIYYPGDTVSISADIPDGYDFVKWDTDSGIEICSSSTGYYFTMPAKDVSITAVTVGSSIGSSPSDKFVDIPASFWAKEAVDFAMDRGLFHGKTDTTFCPDDAMNRAMLVTVLYRLDGKPDVSSYENSFNDLDDNSYYEGIIWASNCGITSGYDDGGFHPYDNLTRQQLASFLMRYAKYKGYDVSGSADLSVFTDADSLAAYAVSPMQWAVKNGIISGTSATTLDPTAYATRAQVAVMLQRFVNNIVD